MSERWTLNQIPAQKTRRMSNEQFIFYQFSLPELIETILKIFCMIPGKFIRFENNIICLTFRYKFGPW